MKKKRGAWLVFWLLLVLLINAWFALTYLWPGILPAAWSAVLPQVSGTLAWAYGALALLNVLCVLGMFAWSKVAFYLFGIGSVLIFVFNLAAIEPRLVTVWGLLGVAILYLLLRPRWQFFR